MAYLRLSGFGRPKTVTSPAPPVEFQPVWVATFIHNQWLLCDLTGGRFYLHTQLYPINLLPTITHAGPVISTVETIDD